MNSTSSMAFRFLEGLGRVSAQGAVLILMVLLAQWMFRRWLTPRWRCALWILVVGRLMLPVSVPTRLSVFNFAAAARGSSGAPASSSNPLSAEAPDPSDASSGLAAASSSSHSESGVGSSSVFEPPAKNAVPISSTKNEYQAEPAAPATLTRSWRLSWPIALFALWLTGVMVLAGHVLMSSIRVARRVRELPQVTDHPVLSILEQCRVRMGVTTSLSLVEGASIHSPAHMSVLLSGLSKEHSDRCGRPFPDRRARSNFTLSSADCGQRPSTGVSYQS